MKIVSGKIGKPHVTSHEFRQIIEGTIGQESYILKSGDNLEPELVSNNLLKIKSGMMSHHGNVSSVDNYDEIELMNGTQGMKRIDLIVNRYTRNDETKIENNSWVCIVGTPDASSPTVPAYTVGNIQEGDLTDDCPYLEVHYDGINVTEVKKLLSVAKNASEMEAELTELNKKSLKYEDFEKSCTCAGSSRAYFDIGTLNIPSGYKLLGILPVSGREDWWQVSYSVKSDNVINAVVYNYFSSSITATLKLSALYAPI